MTEQKLFLSLQRILGRFGDNWSGAVIDADIADIKRAFKEAGYVKLAELTREQRYDIWKQVQAGGK